MASCGKQNGSHTRRYTLACRMCARKHTRLCTRAQAHKHPSAPSGSGWSLAFCANKQVVDWTFIPAHKQTHTETQKHTHTHLRWWSELPCCVDLYQSRDIKLNWQTGGRTTPTLQSAALCWLSVHVYVCTWKKIMYARKWFLLAHQCVSLCSKCLFFIQIFASVF